jgi:hypothetical protein
VKLGGNRPPATPRRKIILKLKLGGSAWIRLIWHRTRAGGVFLNMVIESSGLLASQGLHPMQLIN